MAKLAILPIPLEQRPLYGSIEGYERVREQARVQVEARTQNTPVYEFLPVVDCAGFCNLPEPSRLDMFLDLEGDPYAPDGGRQYLFAFVTADRERTFPYEMTWCFTAEEEKQAFEWIVDEIMRRWTEALSMHVYHLGSYEPSKFKWLMGRYATREDEIDRMLRAGLFIDLHTICKQAMRAGVEEYCPGSA